MDFHVLNVNISDLTKFVSQLLSLIHVPLNLH